MEGLLEEWEYGIGVRDGKGGGICDDWE